MLVKIIGGLDPYIQANMDLKVSMCALLMCRNNMEPQITAVPVKSVVKKTLVENTHDVEASSYQGL